MKKLIESKQEHSIVCDNPNCDFKVKNDGSDEIETLNKYLNKTCPDCGCNLLTDEDYKTATNLIKTINWLNKYFSWLTIFSKKKASKKVSVKVHKGIKITK